MIGLGADAMLTRREPAVAHLAHRHAAVANTAVLDLAKQFAEATPCIRLRTDESLAASAAAAVGCARQLGAQIPYAVGASALDAALHA